MKKINQIKTKKELDNWIKQKKKQLDKQTITLIESQMEERKRLENKYFEKLKEIEEYLQ
jgi:hypothetical protein